MCHDVNSHIVTFFQEKSPLSTSFPTECVSLFLTCSFLHCMLSHLSSPFDEISPCVWSGSAFLSKHTACPGGDGHSGCPWLASSYSWSIATPALLQLPLWSFSLGLTEPRALKTESRLFHKSYKAFAELSFFFSSTYLVSLSNSTWCFLWQFLDFFRTARGLGSSEDYRLLSVPFLSIILFWFSPEHLALLALIYVYLLICLPSYENVSLLEARAYSQNLE